jgi:hypothetical protein
MKNAAFWDVTPCGSCKNRRYSYTIRLVSVQLATSFLKPECNFWGSVCILSLNVGFEVSYNTHAMPYLEAGSGNSCWRQFLVCNVNNICADFHERQIIKD